MKLNNLFTLALVFLAQSAFAQPTTTRLPDEQVEAIGDERTQVKDSYNALSWYEKLYERNPDNILAIYKVASTHDKLRDYPMAEEWFKKLVEKDQNKEYKLARYNYARVLKLNGKYDDCILEYQSFLKEYTADQPNYDYYKKMSEAAITGAKWTRTNTEPKEELIIENMGNNVNSPSTESAAFPLGREKVIFSSLRSDTLIFLEEDEDLNKYSKIYYSTTTTGSDWTGAAEYEKETTQKNGFHIAQPTFNTDLTKFYFVRAKLDGNSLKNSRIYVADHTDGKIGEATLLPFNSDKFSCRNPAVAQWGGKEYLLFTSNMEGGQGGFDIWYAEINADGTTKEPLNLTAVNTIGDEITPFFDERDDMFYFASDGQPGMGGYDVFSCQRNPNNGELTTPVNMGAGYNSSVDDFGFIMNKQGNDDCYGYVVSNRIGTISLKKSQTCCDDIFSIVMPERCDIICEVDILEDPTDKSLEGATVQLIDKATGKVVDEQTNNEDNHYTFLLEMGKEYEVRSSKETHETGSIVISTAKQKLKEDGFDITKPIEFTKEVKMKELGLMVRTYDKKANTELTGVTVTIFDAATGKELKKETLTGGSQFAFSLPRNKDYKIFAKREGYIADSRVVSKGDLGMLQKMYLTPPPVFYNVYFDFNKHNIRNGANDTLDMVAKTLSENPDMVVEVRGHTDSKGTDEYNVKLADQRTANAIAYLKNKGIEESRLQAKGFGETMPAADNEKADGSDNPEGRQLNRRVEFKIVSMGAVGMVTEKKN